MRFQVRRFGRPAEGDLTPMIDMTFQLIAFFMVLINFTEADQNEEIRLPSSVLARPPETPPEAPLTLQVTEQGEVLFGGSRLNLDTLRPQLIREREVMRRLDQNPAAATVIIRAHALSKAGLVQELVKLCQEIGFETFALRAKEEESA